jgi:hypothetical protein
MKTRDSEALQFVLESGLFRINYDTGDIETSRDRRGRPTEPPVWRSATFLSPSKKSSTRKRLWVKGRRVYANRAAWVLHNQKAIPDGYQIDHEDDDSLNDRPSNLVLMDAEGNRVKELARGRVKRFVPFSETGEGEFPFTTTGYRLEEQPCTPQLDYNHGDIEFPEVLYPIEVEPRGSDPYGVWTITYPTPQGDVVAPLVQPSKLDTSIAQDIKYAWGATLVRLRAWLYTKPKASSTRALARLRGAFITAIQRFL